MAKTRACLYLCVRGVAALLVISFGSLLFGQQGAQPSNLIAFNRAAAPAIAPGSLLPMAPSQHKFWDGKNRFLFSSAAAFSMADFSVTRMNLASGGRELNPIVRPFTGNSALLAANFAGQTAGVVAISYLFHRTGHHRLERMTPLANIAASAFAVSYGLSHR
jgi:hypothetical protein